MTRVKILREYFKQNRKVALVIELLIAILSVTLSMLFFGRHEGAFIGFFIYIFISKFIGTGGSFIDPDKLIESGKTEHK
ncbi:hypothetical protein [Bacillus paralicheniformis]|uniref:hypothetical protein n=1 Tax=Bacillus paralicheniformis TaxID=1648923 RepID=UPI001324B7F0|nr:hypothetical protein [Bacillus paralicheniformis]MPQ26513.1 hypothetical protein [Bacillus paralicheniformis]